MTPNIETLTLDTGDDTTESDDLQGLISFQSAPSSLLERLETLVAVKRAGRTAASKFLAELVEFGEYVEKNDRAIRQDIDAAYYEVQHNDLGHLMCSQDKAQELSNHAELLKSAVESGNQNIRSELGQHIHEVQGFIVECTRHVIAVEALIEKHNVCDLAQRSSHNPTANNVAYQQRLKDLQDLQDELDAFIREHPPRTLSTQPRVRIVPFLSAARPLNVFSEPFAQVSATSAWHSRRLHMPRMTTRTKAPPGFTCIGDTMQGRVIWASSRMLLVEDESVTTWDEPLRDFQIDARGHIWARGDGLLCAICILSARIFTMNLPEKAAKVHLPSNGLVIYEQTDGMLVGLLCSPCCDVHQCPACTSDPCADENVPPGVTPKHVSSESCVSGVVLSACPDGIDEEDIVRGARVRGHRLLQPNWAHEAAQYIHEAHWEGVRLEATKHCMLGAVALWVVQTPGVGVSRLIRDDVLCVQCADGTSLCYTTQGHMIGDVSAEKVELEEACRKEWPWVHDKSLLLGSRYEESGKSTLSLTGGATLTIADGWAITTGPASSDIVC